MLVQYAWPGNVRELENAIESLMALSVVDDIGAAELPKRFKEVPEDMDRSAVFHGSLQFEEAEKVFETEMILKALRRTNYVQTRGR